MSRRLLPLLILLPALACGHAAAAEAVKTLTPAQKQALDIRTGSAQRAVHVPLDGLPARVSVPLTGSAVVTAPYEGVVVELLAREGQTVRQGQTLARIRSREAMTLGADLAAAQGEFRVASAQAGRDRQLLAEGIIPAARAQADEARSAAAAARLRELQAARAMAPAGAVPGTYELRAPIAGRVLERALQLGEPVAMFAKAYVLAAGNQVMLEMQVPARDAAGLRPGLPVQVAGGGGEGRVSEIGGAVDPASQTVRVRADVDGGRLLVGQQVRATLLLPAPANAVQVPSEAVIEREGQTRVYVARDGGFVAVPVQRLAQTTTGESVITGAVAAGTELVVRGAARLDAMPAGGQ
ncbi:MAG: efflux RND transporter periplasmic adaptor subunit [Xanthomonadaceae bacterium]|nr:efflux RND transporter periplasmic adaptor subunit [Xanthomonadaceae bacterium]MDE1964793.1 efflux RND transporter periplasmic adaptor subunit [Xanthomonadaceae bacterium]